MDKIRLLNKIEQNHRQKNKNLEARNVARALKR